MAKMDTPAGSFCVEIEVEEKGGGKEEKRKKGPTAGFAQKKRVAQGSGENGSDHILGKKEGKVWKKKGEGGGGVSRSRQSNTA